MRRSRNEEEPPPASPVTFSKVTNMSMTIGDDEDDDDETNGLIALGGGEGSSGVITTNPSTMDEESEMRARMQSFTLHHDNEDFCGMPPSTVFLDDTDVVLAVRVSFCS